MAAELDDFPAKKKNPIPFSHTFKAAPGPAGLDAGCQPRLTR